MPSFSFIKAIITSQYGWRLQWKLEGADAGHEVVVERASGPEGPWEEVGTAATTDSFFNDTDSRFRSYFDVYFYRLKVRDPVDSSIKQTSVSVSTSGYANRHIQKIIREYEKVLYKVNTNDNRMIRRMACFKRTIDGTTCPDCVNPDTGQRMLDRCPTCGGTGYTEGWANPVKFNMRFQNGKQKATPIVPRLAESEELQRMAWTGPFPMLEPGDLLVEKSTNDHWRVGRIWTSEPNNVLVSQRFQAEYVDREHIENELVYPGESL